MIDFGKVVITHAIYKWSSFYGLIQINKRNVSTKCNADGVLIKEVFEMDNSLKFIIRYNEDNTIKRVEMQISFHKYFAQGYNYNDYTFSQLCRTIITLSTAYGFNLSKAIIQNIEIGANILLNTSVDSFISGLYFYNATPFNVMKNSFRTPVGIEATLSDYTVKAYNKRTQLLTRLDIGRECLRYELHFNKMRKVNACGVYSLADLLEYQNIYKLAELLCNSLDGLIHYSSEYKSQCNTTNEKQLLNDWSNPKKIMKLSKEQPQKYRRQRRLFKQLSQRNKALVLPTVQRLIKRKANNLLTIDRTTMKEVNYYKAVIMK